jgi:hypothetical protein
VVEENKSHCHSVGYLGPDTQASRRHAETNTLTQGTRKHQLLAANAVNHQSNSASPNHQGDEVTSGQDKRSPVREPERFCQDNWHVVDHNVDT